MERQGGAENQRRSLQVDPGNNGMFVGDEQYKQCALVVLGKGDLVRAMLEGKDIPQNGPKLDVVIKHYEEFVADMKAKQYLSHYVYPKDVARPRSASSPAQFISELAWQMSVTVAG
ncbi:TPA: hypothetical protein ACH3X1_016434 [Trebouxia sp. C0004]